MDSSFVLFVSINEGVIPDCTTRYTFMFVLSEESCVSLKHLEHLVLIWSTGLRSGKSVGPETKVKLHFWVAKFVVTIICAYIWNLKTAQTATWQTQSVSIFYLFIYRQSEMRCLSQLRWWIIRFWTEAATFLRQKMGTKPQISAKE